MGEPSSREQEGPNCFEHNHIGRLHATTGQARALVFVHTNNWVLAYIHHISVLLLYKDQADVTVNIQEPSIK